MYAPHASHIASARHPLMLASAASAAASAAAACVDVPGGQAGGKYKATPVGGDSVYFDTAQAKMGDFGSRLPATPEKDMTTWQAGTQVDVAWGMRYNRARMCSPLLAQQPPPRGCSSGRQ